MSESLKFSQNLKTSAAREWPIGLHVPQRDTISASVSPFSRIESPFHDDHGRMDFAASALPLVKKLCESLHDEQISYCHWKSNWKLGRWVGGEGDLDLLVAPAHTQRFVSTCLRLGFVQAIKVGNEDTPGIVHFYGWDEDAEKFVHLHVYTRLVVGHDLTNNYHLPIEGTLLSSAVGSGPIPVPELEVEIIVFVVRKVLSSWTTETLLRRLLGLSSDFEKITDELNYLEAHTDRSKVHQSLSQVFPGLTISLFEECLESLRLESSLGTRTLVRHKLEKVLATHARRGRRVDSLLKIWRLLSKSFTERILRRPSRKRSVNGGALIALVGGDGSGKTTAVNSVRKWLGNAFEVKTFHFGKPRRSPITLALIIALRTRALLNGLLRKPFPYRREDFSSNRPGYLRMLRWVCAARDRHRVYVKARRFTSNGGIAVCDRYVLPHIRLMDGPNIAHTMAGTELNWFTKILQRAEDKRYEEIMPPDLLLVLRVDPDVAVRRKTDEREQHVRPRSQEIWDADWSGTRARVIDAGKPAETVLAELRTQVWLQI